MRLPRALLSRVLGSSFTRVRLDLRRVASDSEDLTSSRRRRSGTLFDGAGVKIIRTWPVAVPSGMGTLEFGIGASHDLAQDYTRLRARLKFVLPPSFGGVTGRAPSATLALLPQPSASFKARERGEGPPAALYFVSRKCAVLFFESVVEGGRSSGSRLS